jgi:hypothetical protein
VGTVTPLRDAWRKRLANSLRKFRKVRGYWPDRSIVSAMKRGIEQCIDQGIKTPVEH